MKFQLIFLLIFSISLTAEARFLKRKSRTSCDMNFTLNSYKYNCQIYENREKSFTYSSNCNCEIVAKERSASSEGPLFNLIGKKCNKVQISNKDKKHEKFHNIIVNTFEKDQPLQNGHVINFKYLNVKKNSCN